MSALYRRFRPLTFQEVVGQEHVKEPLLKAIREGRLAQAYLFSGPRGVGKTTTARLLAMAVGCQGEDPPCGVCPHCQAVQRGAHPDVVEIDAASNNSVEDVRELRERIHLAPLSAPRKVFILDEAHMLSKSAFNALLKTLEEPPPHVLFVFATTEPERMPPTILSRTQHFRFRRLTEEEIAFKLRRILEAVGREAEEEALLLLARLADGALRDAESLLERFLLLEGPLTRKEVERALGLPPREALAEIAASLARGKTAEALGLARRLYGEGYAPRSLVSGLLEVFREGLYAAFSLAGTPLPAPPQALIAAMTALDEAMERLARRSDALSLEVTLLEAGRALAAEALPQPTGAPSPEVGPKPESPPAPEPPRPEEAPDLRERWRAFLEALRPTLRAFVREARPEVREGQLCLAFPEDKAFHYRKALEQKARLLPLAQAHFGVEEVVLVLEGEKKSLSPRPRPAPPPEAPAPPSPPEEEVEAEEAAEEAPEEALRRVARLLGGRVLWVRRPRTREAPEEEPLSQDEIGGTGI